MAIFFPRRSATFWAQMTGASSGLSRSKHQAAWTKARRTAEGSGVRGGHRTERYLTALGSARESVAALDYATSAGYIAPLRQEAVGAFDQIIGTLVNNTIPRRRR